MKTVAQIISGIALAGTILPSLLFFSGKLELDPLKFAMLIATILWFVATPFWMEHKADS